MLKLFPKNNDSGKTYAYKGLKNVPFLENLVGFVMKTSLWLGVKDGQ